MLEVLLWISAALWTVFFLQLVISMLTAPDLETIEVGDDTDCPSVSIVVPARNEEDGIRAAVTSFCEQDYSSLEVIVVDDGSTDRTPQILAELQAEFANLTVVQAAEPPPGWMGKVNALETGRRLATGDWLVFVDADVVYDPRVLRRAVAVARREHAAMIVLGPRFVTDGAVEAAILSNLYLMGLAVFPVYLVRLSSSRYFATGGGVFNMVRRDALEAAGAFASLRGEVVDDVALGFRVKAAGHRIVPARSGTMVSVRMYHGVRDTIRGFTKNIYPAIERTNLALVLIPFTLGAVINLLPYLGFASGLAGGRWSLPSIIALAFMHATMAIIAVVFRQPWPIVFLSPVRELCWWVILIRSAWRYKRHGLVWRGRKYERD